MKRIQSVIKYQNLVNDFVTHLFDPLLHLQPEQCVVPIKEIGLNDWIKDLGKNFK